MNHLWTKLSDAVRTMPPNLFAIVMATGIVSLAAHGAGFDWVANLLFGLNLAFYAVLWLMLLARCLFHFQALRTDFHTHAQAPGFFTVIAATDVLGGQCVLLAEAGDVAVALWSLSLLLWFGLTYTLLPTLMETKTKPSLLEGLNSGWLLEVVATQTVCVLGCLVVPQLGREMEPALFAAFSFWLAGGMLYGWLIALIVYRKMFLVTAPRHVTPEQWIDMGAMAVSTLAGVLLVQHAAVLPLLGEMLPFLKGVTLLFWATATWWIPMLLALTVWRHWHRRFPPAYEHAYWAAVFPLGMYTVCTQKLSHEFQLPFLEPLPHVFVWIALAAWTAAFIGLGHRLVSRLTE